MAQHRITLDFRVSTHTDQFRNVHKAVFKDGFRDHTGAFSHQIQQTELRLHVCREARMRRGTESDRFRTLPFHIKAYPVVTGFDFRPGFAQLGQYRIQRIRLGVTAQNFTA